MVEDKSLGFMYLWRARAFGFLRFWHLCELYEFVRAASVVMVACILKFQSQRFQ
jgi:hypothetical protein